MRVMITGAAGFIGGYLAKHCVDAGCATGLDAGLAAGRYLGFVIACQPDLEPRQHRHGHADHDIDNHGIAVLEAKQPGRYDQRDPGKQDEPFLPDRKSGERRDR